MRVLKVTTEVSVPPSVLIAKRDGAHAPASQRSLAQSLAVTHGVPRAPKLQRSSAEQWPLRHSVPAPHVLPAAARAQTPSIHVPDIHSSSIAQGRSAAPGSQTPLHAPERGRPLTLAVRLAGREPLPLVVVALAVRDRRGITVVDEVWGSDTGSTLSVEDVPAEFEAKVTLPPLLPAGDFVLGVWIGSSYDTFLEEEALRFRVWPRADDPADLVERDRLVHPDVTWSLVRTRS